MLSNIDNLGRSSWQKPAFIVSKLGDIEDKTIADIGAGTGYFTFHLAYLHAQVIALDIDTIMLSYIDTYKEKLPQHIRKEITTRIAKTDDPLLSNAEIDGAIIINTAGYIDDLTGYLQTLKPSFKAGGKIVVVDYKTRDTEIPAPPADKLLPMSELILALESAGYNNINSDANSLEYQYVVWADVGM